MTAAFVLALQLAQVPARPPVAPDVPATAPEPVPPPDPATSAFATNAGLLLVVIKADKVDDYESVIRALQEALANDTDEARRHAAEGWRVFRATEPDGKGNAVYIHALWPAVPGFDYRPSLLLDTLVTDLAPGLLEKYRESFASPPTKLSLSELAHMSVAPAPLPELPAPPAAVQPKKPGGR